MVERILCTRSARRREEDMESFCCVVVGNRIDINVESGSEDSGARVMELETLQFLERLVPTTAGSEEDIPPITIQSPGELVVPHHIYTQMEMDITTEINRIRNPIPLSFTPIPCPPPHLVSRDT